MFLAKDLIRATQAKIEQLVNNVNDGMIDLRNTIIRKEITENENTSKIVDIVEKIVDFNKQQKGKGITGNTSGNLLNEIRQILYSLYQEEEVTKKVYTNIMNSMKL